LSAGNEEPKELVTALHVIPGAEKLGVTANKFAPTMRAITIDRCLKIRTLKLL